MNRHLVTSVPEWFKRFVFRRIITADIRRLTPADSGHDETRHDHRHEYEADLRGDDDVRWDA